MQSLQASTTISSRSIGIRVVPEHQAGYTSGQVGIDTMINAVPGIKDLANLKGEQIANVGSQDMSFDIMLKLAKRINELTRAALPMASSLRMAPTPWRKQHTSSI